jgi:hypothetical protein
MGFRQYEVTEQAIRQAKAAGLCGDVEKRIARMARRAAPFTHEYGNWRFEDFVLFIKDGKVLDVTRLDMVSGNS